jgi:hypothetical protein
LGEKGRGKWANCGYRSNWDRKAAEAIVEIVEIVEIYRGGSRY